jgi:hypothetical protein
MSLGPVFLDWLLRAMTLILKLSKGIMYECIVFIQFKYWNKFLFSVFYSPGILFLKFSHNMPKNRNNKSEDTEENHV